MDFILKKPSDSLELLGFLKEYNRGRLVGATLDLTVKNFGEIPKEDIPNVVVNEKDDYDETWEHSGCKITVHGLKICRVDKGILLKTLENCVFDEMYGNAKFVYVVYETWASKNLDVDICEKTRISSLFGASMRKTQTQWSSDKTKDEWMIFGYRVVKFKVGKDRKLKHVP